MFDRNAEHRQKTVAVAKAEPRYFVEILRIIEAASEHDTEKLRVFVKSLLDKLKDDGFEHAARQIDRTFNRSRARQLTPQSLTHPGEQAVRVPVDAETHVPLADLDFPTEADLDYEPDPNIHERLVEFLQVVQQRDKLLAAGLTAPTHLLLDGPPGVGKTITARYVAAKLKMPLLTARADSLVSSYLGSTSKNIRALFSAAASQDCILFLDELDAVGKARDDAHELGELKRVVIGLLQNIDSTSSRLILIAATNHQHLLDPAIWRRFPSHIRIGLPSQAFRLALFRRFLRGSLSESFEAFAQAAVGMSGAKIREIVTREQIQSVLHDEPLTTRGMMIALTLSGGSREPCPQTTGSLLRAIKQRNRAYFTNVRLANLLGLSRSEVSAHLRS